jgi:RNA polymerase sigma-70 factor (ECF subfamily)
MVADATLESDLRALPRDVPSRCAQAWPTVTVDPVAFVDGLVARLRDETSPAEALAALNVTDLYLAFACAEGDRAALALLDATHLAQTGRALARMGFAASVVDEALQTLRDTLLLKGQRAAPQILDFSGRGQLAGWLLVVASRIAFRAARPARLDVPWDASLHGESGGDLELAYLKKTYGDLFRAAFSSALRELPPADRTLLQQRYSLGTSVVALGRLYGIHHSNVSRRVEAVRERLVVATRAAMLRTHHLEAGQLSSILRLIRSEIDVSLSSTSDWNRAAE